MDAAQLSVVICPQLIQKAKVYSYHMNPTLKKGPEGCSASALEALQEKWCETSSGSLSFNSACWELCSAALKRTKVNANGKNKRMNAAVSCVGCTSNEPPSPVSIVHLHEMKKCVVLILYAPLHFFFAKWRHFDDYEYPQWGDVWRSERSDCTGQRLWLDD